MPRTSLVALVALLCLSGSAHAADDNVTTEAANAPAPEASVKKRALFPPLRRASEEGEASEAASASEPEEMPPAVEDVPSVVGPDADRPAEEAASGERPAEGGPNEGIWEWVDRMEGEIPSDETVEAIEEREQVEQLLSLIHI